MLPARFDAILRPTQIEGGDATIEVKSADDAI